MSIDHRQDLRTAEWLWRCELKVSAGTSIEDLEKDLRIACGLIIGKNRDSGDREFSLIIGSIAP